MGIIGHGNVALDIARILLKEPDEFKKYQVSQNVLDQLRASDVDEVHLIGRRGPLQASN